MPSPPIHKSYWSITDKEKKELDSLLSLARKIKVSPFDKEDKKLLKKINTKSSLIKKLSKNNYEPATQLFTLRGFLNQLEGANRRVNEAKRNLSNIEKLCAVVLLEIL